MSASLNQGSILNACGLSRLILATALVSACGPLPLDEMKNIHTWLSPPSISQVRVNDKPIPMTRHFANLEHVSVSISSSDLPAGLFESIVVDVAVPSNSEAKATLVRASASLSMTNGNVTEHSCVPNTSTKVLIDGREHRETDVWVAPLDMPLITRESFDKATMTILVWYRLVPPDGPAEVIVDERMLRVELAKLTP